MTRFPAAIAALVVASMAFIACNDEVSEVGSSLIKDQVAIIVDSAFTVEGHSVAVNSVQSRTTRQLLGRINAEGYGNFASDFVTQFMPVEQLLTEGVDDSLIDSVRMIMRVPLGAYVGDSLMPMGVTVHRLTKELSAPIFSDFNPEGYYDPSQKPLGSTTYALTRDGSSQDPKAKKNFRYITVDLDRQFAVDLYNQYRQAPQTFATPEAFAKWFPGVYVTNSFGNGRVVEIDSTVVSVFYRQKLPIANTDPQRDTIISRTSSYLAVTPEIITNNNMSYTISPQLKQRAESGEPILVAPTGYEVEITFPTRQIIERYRERDNALAVVNTLSFTLPVAQIDNPYGLVPPPAVLLVKASQRDTYFLRSNLPDDVNSFYAQYDSYKSRYVFSDMRKYIIEMLEKEEITDDDCRFVVVPVTIGFEAQASGSSYYYYSLPSTTYNIASVTPYISRPAMGLLLLDDARIRFSYSIQSMAL